MVLLAMALGVVSAPGQQTRFLADAVEMGEDGWHRVGWFGDVYHTPETAPWHFDTNLGWITVVDAAAGEAYWIWSAEAQSWFYTRPGLYPYAWDSRNGWVYFQRGGANTWYYVYDTLDWIMISLPPLWRPFDKHISISRFLDQATLGVDLATLEATAETGIEAWLDEQFALPVVEAHGRTRDYLAQYEEGTGPGPWFHAAWWHQVMAGRDLLRQRVVLALSEIIVVSDIPGTLRERPLGMADWYDLLQRHAFGNFRDLLFDVTLHPVMGFYLSHAGNRKADPALNRFPDENYAREIMQLFSIGLHELNLDGTPVLDENGEPIPTYTNREITAFARAFTGLIYDWTRNPDLRDLAVDENLFDNLIEWRFYHFSNPMVMVEREHDTGEKHLLNGTVLPAGQSGLQDINDAIDNLFHHPNVGPFIGRLLIQRLVKSNPSPGYIERVARAFNDNGAGVRGDLQAVIRAILLDQEARNLYHMEDPAQGKMREPFLRYVKLLRAFGASDTLGTYIMGDQWKGENLGQRPFSSPSVFNFFLPDHQPNGVIADAGLVAPEFQITTSQTIPSSLNFFEGAIWEGLRDPDEFEFSYVNDRGEPLSDGQVMLWGNPWFFDTSHLRDHMDDPAALVDHINLLLTNGAMSEETRQVIIDAISPLGVWNEDYGIRIFVALYLTMIAPEFVISR